MEPGIASQDQLQAARNRVETYALSMFAIKGLAMPSRDILAPMIDLAVAQLSPREVAHPDNISLASIGDLYQAVLRSTQADKTMNLYSSDAARSDRTDGGVIGSARKSGDVLERLRANALGGRIREELGGDRASDRSASGARFDDLGSLDWGSPAGLARMRDFAVQKGIPWAANNPELLRLGPAALGSLAEVHFKQETYKSLTTDAAFKAKDVVTLARFAEEQQVDANKLGSSIATVEKGLTPEEKARMNAAVVPYMADSKNPERQKAATKAFDEIEKAHPEKQGAITEARENLQLKRKTLEHANDAAASKNIKAEGKADAFNSLEEPSQSTSKLSKDEKAKPETKQSAPQPVRVSATKTDTPKIAAPKPG